MSAGHVIIFIDERSAYNEHYDSCLCVRVVNYYYYSQSEKCSVFFFYRSLTKYTRRTSLHNCINITVIIILFYLYIYLYA